MSVFELFDTFFFAFQRCINTNKQNSLKCDPPNAVKCKLGGVYMRKLAPARVSHWDDFLISHRVYMMTGSFHILLFNGTFHVVHVWFIIANITHALPVPVYRQTEFHTEMGGRFAVTCDQASLFFFFFF